MAGTRGPLWIVADQQSMGRGRRGRHWQSPPGNLCATGLYHWQGPLADSARLGFAAALAVVQTLQNRVAPSAAITIKWPNDVLLGGAKIAGILLESGACAEGGHWLAAGIGINLVSAPVDMPYPATCLADHLMAGEITPCADALLDILIAAFEDWRVRLQVEGFAPLRNAWLARAHGLGQPLRSSSGQQGIFEDLSSSGTLVLRQANGQSIELSAGEIFFGLEEF